jgi:hypothetical protein
MNRIRHAYLEIAPELEPYFVTSRFDDQAGVLASALGPTQVRLPLQGFIALPGTVSVLDSVVAGAIGAIAALALGAGTALALVVAAVLFCATLAGFAALAVSSIEASRRTFVVRFPPPKVE